MGYYTVTQAIELVGYKRVYICKLIRNKKVNAQRWGRDWLITDRGLAQLKAIKAKGRHYGKHEE
jgi:excisionase family DNA binding protein